MLAAKRLAHHQRAYWHLHFWLTVDKGLWLFLHAGQVTPSWLSHSFRIYDIFGPSGHGNSVHFLPFDIGRLMLPAGWKPSAAPSSESQKTNPLLKRSHDAIVIIFLRLLAPYIYDLAGVEQKDVELQPARNNRSVRFNPCHPKTKAMFFSPQKAHPCTSFAATSSFSRQNVIWFLFSRRRSTWRNLFYSLYSDTHQFHSSEKWCKDEKVLAVKRQLWSRYCAVFQRVELLLMFLSCWLVVHHIPISLEQQPPVCFKSA